MSIAYGGIVAFLFRGLNMAVALTTVLLTSHLLTEDDYGLLLLGLSVVGFVNAMTGGLTAAVAYQVANRRRAEGAALLNGGAPAAALGGLAIAAGIAGGALLDGERSALALPIGAAAAAVILNSVVAGTFLGRDSLVRYNCALVAAPLLSLVTMLIVLVLFDQRTPQAALSAYAAGQWLSLALMVATGAKLLFVGFEFERTTAFAVVRFAFLAAISSGISYLNYRADLFVVEHFEGSGAVGTYGLAVYFGEAVWQVSGSLALATYARLGSLTRPEAAQLTTRVMRHTILLLGLVCLALFLAAGLIESVLFGEKYEGVGLALRILLPGVLLYGLAQSLSGFYTYQRGLPWVSAVIAGAGLAIDMALAVVLIPAMGIKGAALASSAAYGLAIIGGLAVFVRTEHLRPTQVFRFGRADIEDYRSLLARLRALARPTAPPAGVSS